MFITKHLSICQSYIKPQSHRYCKKKKVPTILLLINNEIIKEEYIYIYIYLFIYLCYYLSKGLPHLDSSFFLFKNALTPLCLSKDKTKAQFGKNTTLTPIKTLPKKYGHSPIDFKLLYPLIK